jgi:hypothetical protein
MDGHELDITWST